MISLALSRSEIWTKFKSKTYSNFNYNDKANKFFVEVPELNLVNFYEYFMDYCLCRLLHKIQNRRVCCEKTRDSTHTCILLL